MILRPLEAGDRELLRKFHCSNGTAAQNEVQTFLRKKVFGWLKSTRGSVCLVLVEDTNEIIGAVTWEPGDEPDWWFIKCFAVTKDRQEAGLGELLLGSSLVELERIHPGEFAYWHVDKSNVASHKVSERIGGELEEGPKARKFDRYYVQLAFN